MRDGARERILGRIRTALEGREAPDHPGAFGGWRPHDGGSSAVEAFRGMFESAGGGFVTVRDETEATAWLADFAADHASVSVGVSVPPGLVPRLPLAEPVGADFGISMARGAVAETGSLIMDARDGRRAQLLPPVHVVMVGANTVFRSLREALAALGDDLPSAIGLHSGPSKSADIGQTLVKGVHGPGRVVAVVVGAESPQ